MLISGRLTGFTGFALSIMCYVLCATIRHMRDTGVTPEPVYLRRSTLPLWAVI